MPTHAECWHSVQKLYRSLIARGWPQEPMLEFVSWLSESDYGTRFYASSSMASLRLSLIETWPERLEHPLAGVFYDHRRREFLVTYYQPKRGEVRREVTTCPHAPELLERILAWIGGAETPGAPAGE